MNCYHDASLKQRAREKRERETKTPQRELDDFCGKIGACETNHDGVSNKEKQQESVCETDPD